ncbi:MAG: signal peptide peptidase SppA [Candidatus Cloacimonetes bacterium]|nr:signal peptide peptidase SppA [Candidatus Cloacimonadota bacterium]
MKKIMLIVMLVVISIGLFAQNSVATTDDFMAIKVNPAAISFGNAGGIGFLGEYDSENKNYSILFNGTNGGYLLEQEGSLSNHTLALSSPMMKNLYFGYAWNWQNSDYKEGSLGMSFLYRPFDFMSMGAVANNILDESKSFRTGIAFRPTFLKNDFGNRVTFTVDEIYEDDFVKPIIGIETELLNGVNLAGNYNLETEKIGLNLGLNFGKMGIGHITEIDKESEMSHQQYTYLSHKMFPSILGEKKADHFYDFKGSSIIEKKQGNKFGNFIIMQSKGMTLEALLKKIEKVKNDNSIKGIIFKNSTISANFANLVEIKKAFLDLKSAGKKIVFYDEGYGNIGYAFAASVADEIYLYKTGSVDLRGISINSPYIKKLMDKLGIEMTNFRSHKYKTAGNMFAETEMTEAERESYSYLLQGLYDEMKLMISEGRGDKLTSSVEDVINNGPYFIAQNAVDAGLIDGLIYEDELEEILKDKFGTGKINKKFSCEKARADWSEPIEEKIAVIYAIGNIHMGEGKPGKTIGSVTTAKAIKKAREDKSVKGIVLCVNSGGGSALASDIIGREVELCNDGENKKPVIALMTGTAASGGYYISAFADKIVAQPTTITGSIGVIGMIPNFEGLYEKIGVNWSSVKMGAHSDFASTNRKLTDDEYKHIEESIEHVYWEFVDIVAEGRGMTRAEVHEIARGRVWTGKQAQERGLVDEMGGMDKAIEELKKLANIQAEVNLIEFDGYNQNVFKFALDFDLKQKLNIPKEMEMLLEISDELQVYDGEKVLMMMPKIVVE